MKGYFNYHLTKYFVRATGIKEITYIEKAYHPFLESQGFKWEQYCTWIENDELQIRIIYSTNPKYWSNYVYENLTNYKF